MAKTKICKYCQSEIPAKAKVCPVCRKKQGSIVGTVLKAILAVFVLFIVIGIFGGSGSKETASGTQNTGSVETAKNESSDSGEASSAPLYEVTNVVKKVTVNSFDNGYYYDGIVEVVNKSEGNIRISNEKFDVLDPEGVSVSHDSFSLEKAPEILMPGEKGYIYTMFSQGLTDITEEESQNLDLQYSFDVSKTSSESYRFPVTDVNVSAEGNGVKVVGTVENDTDKDVSYQYINIILFDASGTPIYAGGTSLTDFTAGKKVKFETSGYLNSVDINSVASYTIIAER